MAEQQGAPLELELVATGVTSDGDGVAREPSGRVVFTPELIPGERALVEIVAEKRKSATGSLLRVIEPSPHRVDPACRFLPQGCGGCQWQHIDAGEQRRLKLQIVSNALRRAGVEPPAGALTVEMGPWAYRTTIRAAVVGGRAALRRRRSSEVLEIDDCLVAHPLLAELLHDGRFGAASEVVLRCGARTGERMAATVPAGALIDVPADVRRTSIHEEAAGRRWRVSAGSFFQARPDGADALAGIILAAAGEPAAAGALDLYAGVGLFAGALAGAGWEVVAVESAPGAVADARVNLVDLGVQVVEADVTRWTPAGAGLVVADPSRNGLGRPGVKVVDQSGAGRLVLVSCDAISLGRDAGLLKKAGFEMTAMTMVDMFPQTVHVEVVSVFER